MIVDFIYLDRRVVLETDLEKMRIREGLNRGFKNPVEKSPFIKKSQKIKSYQFETLFSRTRKKSPRNLKHMGLYFQ